MSTTQLHITLKQLDEWSNITFNFGIDNFKHIETFIQTMEMFPPRGLQNMVRPLIVDEGVAPENLVIWVVDDGVNDVYHFNPALDKIFELVYEPVTTEIVDIQKIINDG